MAARRPTSRMTLSAQLLFSAQYAFTTLPPPVLGFYGGEAFGRAYDPGALAGNSLATAALQVGQHIDTGLPWLSDLNLFAFADYGAAWNPCRLALRVRIARFGGRRRTRCHR